MEIDGVVIRTPREDPWGYDVDWRHKVALQAIKYEDNTGKLCKYRYQPDDYLRSQTEYIRQTVGAATGSDEKAARINSVRCVKYRRENMRYAVASANSLFSDNNVIKYKLEALLLCPELNLNDIAQCVSEDMDPLIIQMYEKLFYNVRDAVGKTKTSPMLREYFALNGEMQLQDRNDLPLYWRVVAIEGGYKALCTIWRWPLPEGEIADVAMSMMAYRSVMQLVDKRVRFEEIDHRSLINMVGELREIMSDLRERGVISKGDNISEDSILRSILAELAPQVLVPDAAALEKKKGDVDAKLAMIRQVELSSGTISNTLDSITAQIDNAAKQ